MWRESDTKTMFVLGVIIVVLIVSLLLLGLSPSQDNIDLIQDSPQDSPNMKDLNKRVILEITKKTTAGKDTGIKQLSPAEEVRLEELLKELP